METNTLNITPGKWIAVKVTDGWVIKEKELYERGFSDKIAELYNYDQNMEANAQAIASLPTLLKENEALKSLLNTHTCQLSDALKEVDELNKKVANIDNQIAVAVEFGYLQCERGNNIQMAFINFNKIQSQP